MTINFVERGLDLEHLGFDTLGFLEDCASPLDPSKATCLVAFFARHIAVLREKSEMKELVWDIQC
jgi:hypothetical protein